MESIVRRLAILETEDAEKWSGYTEAVRLLPRLQLWSGPAHTVIYARPCVWAHCRSALPACSCGAPRLRSRVTISLYSRCAS